MRSSCVAILIVCTSLDSQRRAVLKWKQSRSCQGTISFSLYMCVRVKLCACSVMCILVYFLWVSHRSIRKCSLLLSAVCNMLLAVSIVPYITVSNMDKLAQKLC